MERNVARNCQDLLKLVRQKRVSNGELKADFRGKFEKILSVISEGEQYKTEVKSYGETRLLQHVTLDEELEEIEFRLEEINIQENTVEDELKKVEEELQILIMKFRFTKVFYWE